jgi:hypothetical protein
MSKLPDPYPPKSHKLPPTEAELAKEVREKAFRDAQMAFDLSEPPKQT